MFSFIRYADILQIPYFLQFTWYINICIIITYVQFSKVYINERISNKDIFSLMLEKIIMSYLSKLEQLNTNAMHTYKVNIKIQSKIRKFTTKKLYLRQFKVSELWHMFNRLHWCVIQLSSYI